MVPHFLERRGTIHFAKRVKFAKLINRWALGAVVSAFVSHAKGREFESHSAHKIETDQLEFFTGRF